MAISGNTVVAGAPGEASNATGVNGNQSNNFSSSSGAAYVFVSNGVTWTQQAYLKPSNTGTGDQFGRSVTISGDTVVIGATGESSSATGVNGDQSDNTALFAGAAYVFVRSGAIWTQQAYLKASNAEARDNFGYSVAVSGDTAVVGATDEASIATGVNGNQSDNSASHAGAAYVFARGGSAWTQQAYLKAPNHIPAGVNNNGRFGLSVSISGETIAVGDIYGVGDPGSGAASVFVRSGSVWALQGYFMSPPQPDAFYGGSFDAFGTSVAISGDTVVVGAPQDASDATGVNGDPAQISDPDNSTGAAWVFVRNGTAWSQQAYLKSNGLTPGGLFGSVAISGDLLIVGSPGAAFTFRRSGGTWIQDTYLPFSSSPFSPSVAVSGETILLGDTPDSSNAKGVDGLGSGSATNSGAGYVFGTPEGTVSITIASLQLIGYHFTTSGQGCAPGTYTMPLTLAWTPGALCAISISDKEGDGQTEYRFNQWEDFSILTTRYILVPATATTYTASFDTFFKLDTFVFVGGTLKQSASVGLGAMVSPSQFVLAGATASVTATPSAGYFFTSFSGAVNTTSNPISLVMFAPRSIQANFATGNVISSLPSGRTFTLTGTGCSPGSYTTPQTLNWTAGASCSVSFATPQTAPGTEYRFGQWENGSTSSTRSITASSAGITYTATFNTWYQLTTSAGAGGAISAGSLYLAGSNAPVTATPAVGYAFNSFTGGITSPVNPGLVLMDAPKSVIANFVESVSIASVPSGRTFTSTGTGCTPGTYTTPHAFPWTAGTSCLVTFTTPQSATGTEFRFVQWENGGVSTPRSVTASLTATTYTATFDTWYLVTTSAGAGGTVTPGGFFLSGSDAVVRATPTPGFLFGGFTGSVESTENPLTLSMDGPKAIVANFPNGITVGSSIPGLSFTTSGAGCNPGEHYTPRSFSWIAGSVCTVAFATPQASGGTEYRFTQWDDSSADATRSITVPVAPITYTAGFNTYYLLTTSGPSGSISPGGFYLAGTNATVTAIVPPDYGYVFTGTTSNTNPNTVLMDGPRTVTLTLIPHFYVDTATLPPLPAAGPARSPDRHRLVLRTPRIPHVP